MGYVCQAVQLLGICFCPRQRGNGPSAERCRGVRGAAAAVCINIIELVPFLEAEDVVSQADHTGNREIPGDDHGVSATLR